MAEVTTKAADLRDRVTIQFQGQAQDGDTGEPDPNDYGGNVETWAEVIALSGRDFVTANQVQYQASHRVRLRYRANIKPLTTRFLFHGEALNVVHVENVGGRNAQLLCLCRTGASPT